METKGNFLSSKRKVSAGEKWEARRNAQFPSRWRNERGSSAGVFIWGFSEFTQLIRKYTSYGKSSFPGEGSSSFHLPDLPGSPRERFNSAFGFCHACNIMLCQSSLQSSCHSSGPCHVSDLLGKAAESQGCGLDTPLLFFFLLKRKLSIMFFQLSGWTFLHSLPLIGDCENDRTGPD